MIDLRRLFAVLAAAMLLVLALNSAALFFLTLSTADAYGRKVTQTAAQGTAQNLETLIMRLVSAIESLAKDPHLADLAAGGDPYLLRAEEDRLVRMLPGLLRFRILPATIDVLDESRTPHMGYADLDLIRQTQREPSPRPAVHAARTPHEHLAVARPLEPGGHYAVLASFSPQLLEDAMLTPLQNQGAVELRQNALSLAYRGDQTLKRESADGEIALTGTDWKILYWKPRTLDANGTGFLVALAIAGSLIVTISVLVRRWLVAALESDGETLVRLTSEFSRGKVQGNYPFRTRYLHGIALQLTQRRRNPSNVSAAILDKQPLAGLPDETSRVQNSTKPSKEKSPVAVQRKSRQLSRSIFRAYDIRGIVGETLTADVVHDIGLAIGSEAYAKGEQQVIIARDGRLSSPELSAALATGLQASGRGVTDIGMVPTPLLYYATHTLKSRSGVMITGSHNPPNYNGLKIVIAGETLAEEGIQRLRRRIEQENFTEGGGAYETRDVASDYIEKIVGDVQIGRPMKVVMDCGNGVAGETAPRLFEALGCELVKLYCDVDGTFPNHHPDPGKPETLRDLIRTVVSEEADLGIAFDGDGDRLGVVDSRGKIIWPDRQMMLFAADVLSRAPGADIIYDVKCTRHLANQILKRGGRPLMWKTGHSLIKAKIKETGAQLAGEMSGHIFFKERWYGFDDGLYAGARLVEILSGDPRPTSEVFAELPDSVNTPELNVVLAEGENFTFVDSLKAKANFPDARVTDIDGLRVDFPDGFGLVRASNTTPSLVIRFEAETPASLERIQRQFRDLMKRVKPDISLPF
jgi:phosphomannomutase/phosphoglucomutase